MVSRTHLATASLCAHDRALQSRRGDRMHKGLLAVDDDHREIDAVSTDDVTSERQLGFTVAGS